MISLLIYILFSHNYIQLFLKNHLHQVYAPLLLDDGRHSRQIDPKLQSLLSELEAGLGSAIRKKDPSFRGRAGGDNAEDNLGSKCFRTA